MRPLIAAPLVTDPDDDPLAPARGVLNALILTALLCGVGGAVALVVALALPLWGR